MEWFIYYTYPKSERIVKNEFEKRNFEVFLPLIKIKRIWSDRIKELEVPLFSNYIFIKSNKCDIYKIIKHPKIVKYLAFEGKPSVLKDEEIICIKKFLNNSNDIAIGSRIMGGDCVKIISGPLKGLTGKLIETKNSKRFEIYLTELKQTMSIGICLENVEKIIELELF